MIGLKIILALVLIGFMGFRVGKFIYNLDKGVKTSPVQPIVTALLVLGIIMLVFPAIGEVPAGYRGVVLRFGAVTGRILDSGLYFVTPLVEGVELMDCQTHANASKAGAASKDLQNVVAEITVNYRLDPNRAAEVYRDLRQDYVARIMVPAIAEAVKAATAMYDAERIIIERPAVKDRIEQYLQERLTHHGLIVDGVSITDFRFSEDFEKAIEAKVTATQEALKAKNDLETVKMEAEQRIARARAEAEAIRIQAQAVNAQGGEDYVKLKAIEKWNGSVPQWMGGGQPVPFVSMSPPGR